MEKDIDEVSKIARLAKSKLEELDKDVSQIARLPREHFN
jgi:archaellum component FlaC